MSHIVEMRGGGRKSEIVRDKVLIRADSQHTGSLGHHLRYHNQLKGTVSQSSLGSDMEAREGAQLSPSRPVRSTDGCHNFNPPTCWDAERPSSGKAAPSLAILVRLPEG